MILKKKSAGKLGGNVKPDRFIAFSVFSSRIINPGAHPYYLYSVSTSFDNHLILTAKTRNTAPRHSATDPDRDVRWPNRPLTFLYLRSVLRHLCGARHGLSNFHWPVCESRPMHASCSDSSRSVSHSASLASHSTLWDIKNTQFIIHVLRKSKFIYFLRSTL